MSHSNLVQKDHLPSQECGEYCQHPQAFTLNIILSKQLLHGKLLVIHVFQVYLKAFFRCPVLKCQNDTMTGRLVSPKYID